MKSTGGRSRCLVYYMLRPVPEIVPYGECRPNPTVSDDRSDLPGRFARSSLLQLLERILGSVSKAEYVAHERNYRVGLTVVMVGFSRRQANCSPRIVKELILEPHGHVGNCIAISFSKVRPSGEKRGELALADLISVITKLQEEQSGIVLVA
jgi:hypothetical protein